VSLNIVDDQLDLSPGIINISLGFLQISQGSFHNSSLNDLTSDLCSGGPGNEGLAETSGREGDGSLEVVPLLSGKRVDNLLTLTTLLIYLFTLSDSH